MPILLSKKIMDLYDSQDVSTGSTLCSTANGDLALPRAPPPLKQIPLSLEDYSHLSLPADRYRIVSEVCTLLQQADGQTLLLSRVGSLLSQEARASMRHLRLRFLTFLHEQPHADYLHIVGVGGAQSLVLDAQPATSREGNAPSVPRLRAEIVSALTREAPCLLRTLGSLLSLDGRRALQVAGVKLSKFIASDPAFVITDNFVSFAPGKDPLDRPGMDPNGQPVAGGQRGMERSDARVADDRLRSRDVGLRPTGASFAPGMDQPIASGQRAMERSDARFADDRFWSRDVLGARPIGASSRDGPPLGALPIGAVPDGRPFQVWPDWQQGPDETRGGSSQRARAREGGGGGSFLPAPLDAWPLGFSEPYGDMWSM
jgi:hypothetical protein